MTGLARVGIAFFFSVLVPACVSARAGYEGVRELSAARLGHDVRWHQDGARKGIDAETEKLLDPPLDADAAVRIALLNNASLQAAFEDLGMARAELVSALSLPNPHVGAALRYGPERPELEVDATISLSKLLFLPWRNGVGQAGLEAAQLEVAGRAVDIGFDARAALYRYQAAEQRLELQRTVVGSLWAASDMAARMHQAGNITDLTLQSEQAVYEEARLLFARAEAEVFEQREQLNTAMGLFGPPAAAWTAQAKLPEAAPVAPLLAEVEARAVLASLDLAASRKRFEHAARRANLSSVEGWVPELRAGISAERAEAEWSVGPAAEVEIPLFYQGQGETALAVAEMRRERQRLSVTAVAVRMRARVLATRLSTTERGVAFYAQTVLPLRQRIVEETQLQYNAMSVGVFQLLAAKRDEIAAARAYIELLGDYWALRNDLERLLAGRLGQGPIGLSSREMSPGGRAPAASH